MKNHAPFRQFIADFTRLSGQSGNDEPVMLERGGQLLAALVSRDDWLPDECAQAHPDHYQQYLLYCDPLERFSVVSFVWGPGQTTPVHDHTVWGLIGMLRGAEMCHEYASAAPGQPLTAGASHKILPGEIDRVSPAIGDIHQVENALTDHLSISIHVYGANIGAVRRHIFDAVTGTAKPFVSGYSTSFIPNFWDRSAEVRATLQQIP
jgi:predicted metal-dependent enzyme (double-stranded beta helix superfamily)